MLNRSLEPLPASIDSQEITLHQVTPIFPSFPASPIAAGFIIPRPQQHQQQQMITSGTMKDCVRIRGLPFEATVSEILSYLGEYSRHIVYQGVHLVYNSLVSNVPRFVVRVGAFTISLAQNDPIGGKRDDEFCISPITPTGDCSVKIVGYE